MVFSSRELSSIVVGKVQPQPGEVWRQRLEVGWSHCIYSQEAEDKRVGPCCKASQPTLLPLGLQLLFTAFPNSATS